MGRLARRTCIESRATFLMSSTWQPKINYRAHIYTESSPAYQRRDHFPNTVRDSSNVCMGWRTLWLGGGEFFISICPARRVCVCRPLARTRTIILSLRFSRALVLCVSVRGAPVNARTHSDRKKSKSCLYLSCI